MPARKRTLEMCTGREQRVHGERTQVLTLRSRSSKTLFTPLLSSERRSNSCFRSTTRNSESLTLRFIFFSQDKQEKNPPMSCKKAVCLVWRTPKLQKEPSSVWRRTPHIRRAQKKKKKTTKTTCACMCKEASCMMHAGDDLRSISVSIWRGKPRTQALTSCMEMWADSAELLRCPEKLFISHENPNFLFRSLEWFRVRPKHQK